MKRYLFTALTAICFAVVTCSSYHAPTGNVNEMYKEAEEKFYCNGRPVNPALIDEFSPQLSDTGPTLLNVDLAHIDYTTRYDIPDTVKGTYINYGSESYFQYQWLGKTDNGIHVVRCAPGPEGTGHYENILFFSFKLKPATVNDSSKSKDNQLIMTLVKWRMSYSEMAATKIKIDHNTVKITWHSADGVKVEELKF